MRFKSASRAAAPRREKNDTQQQPTRLTRIASHAEAQSSLRPEMLNHKGHEEHEENNWAHLLSTSSYFFVSFVFFVVHNSFLCASA
jgi:hypothetical protein